MRIEAFVLILTQLLFAYNFIASKIVLQKVDPILFSGIRFFIAGILLFAAAAIFAPQKTKLTKPQWLKTLGVAFLGISLGQSFFLVGLKYTTAVNTSILSTTIPLFGLIFALFRKQVSWSWRLGLGFVLALLGVLLLKGGVSGGVSLATLKGDLLIITACFLLGGYLSYSKDLFSFLSPMWGTAVNFMVGSVVLIPLSFVFGANGIDFGSFDSLIWGNFAFSIIGGTLLTYLFNNWAIRRVDPAYISIFIYLQPVFSAVLASQILDEDVGVRHFVAIVVILCAVVISSKRSKPAQAKL